MSTVLATYMKARQLSDADFGVSINRERSMVSKIRRGIILPTLELAATIESVTGGEVPMQSWVSLESEGAQAA